MLSLLEPLHIVERFNLFFGHFPVMFEPEEGKYFSRKKQIGYCLIVTFIFKIIEALTFFGRQPVADAIGGRTSSMLFYLDVGVKFSWTCSNIWIIVNMFLSRKDYARKMNELIQILKCFEKSPVLPFVYKKAIALRFAMAILFYYVLVTIYGFYYIFKESNDNFLHVNLIIYLIKSYIFLFVCLNEYFLVELLKCVLQYNRMNVEGRIHVKAPDEELHEKISQYLKLNETSQSLATIFTRNYFAKAFCCGMIASFFIYLSLLMFIDEKYCTVKFINSIKLLLLWFVPFIFALIKCTHAKVISDEVSILFS